MKKVTGSTVHISDSCGQTQSNSAKDTFFAGPPAKNVRELVSIIIPVYNEVALTKNCLDSLEKSADSLHCKLIVVNNASADSTAELLNLLSPAVTTIHNTINLGFARACNQGAWAATTPYLLFLNNDTVVTHGWLETMLEACEADVGIVGCRMLYPDGTIQHAGIELINGLPDHPYRHQPADLPAANIPRCDLDMVTGACLLIRRELFMQLGGFDETYRNGVEDVDLCLRVREAGYRVVYQPKAMIYHHEGQSSGRFDHVNHNLHFFSNRWQGRFNGNGHFMAAKQPLITPAEKSFINEQRLHIVWQGSQFVYHSLALVNRELCQRLIHFGHELSIVPFEPDEFIPEPDSSFAGIQGCVNRPLSQPADAVVRHQWPPDFNPPPSGHWVMIQPWEFGSIPLAWVEPITKELDEVWVPSSFVRECYIQSGVSSDKVFVVPNGVDTALYSPGGITYSVASGKSFRFLFVGGTIQRKGIDLLLAAYRKLFSAHDDVCLVIKDMGGASFYQGQTAQEMIRRFAADPAAPEIVYIDSSLTQEEMASLYRSCHCLVHPYRGEGFGLPIAEAMASGLPVIVTGYGAALDFCPPGIAWLVPAQVVRFDSCRVGNIETVSLPWLAEPDLAVLGERMRYAFDHQSEAEQRGQAACDHIRTQFTWDHAARCVEARLQALRTKPIARFMDKKDNFSAVNRADRPADETAKRRERATAAIGQARVAQLRGDSEAAVAMLLQQGIAVAQEWPSPYLALAELLMDEQRFAEALQVVSEMPSTTDRALMYEIEAICQAALGDDEAALKSADLIRQRPRAMVVLGTLAARRGDLAGADAFFRQASSVDPSCGSAWLSQGMLLWGNGDQGGAYRALCCAVLAEPSNNNAVRILCDMSEQNSLQTETLQIIDEAVDRLPDCRNLWQQYTELLAAGGKSAEGLEVSEIFLARFGADEDLVRLALQLRRQIGSYDRLAETGTHSISLCMIVKNEEINLPACLASLKPVVDEIIIVDTGSTDRTVDIATVFGARVLSFVWNDNFSAARNVALTAARGNWILVMDADEVMAEQDHELLRQSVREGEGDKVCWNVLTRNYTRLHPQGWIANDGSYPREERAEGWHPSRKVRLFPRDERIIFQGEVHEMVDRAAEQAGCRIKEAPFVVHHYGALEDRSWGPTPKQLAYFELGLQKLTEHPKDAAAIGELAVQAAEIGRYDAAVSLWDRFLALQPDAVIALFNKGFVLMNLHRYAEALIVSKRALALDPNHREAAFNYGMCELYAGDPGLALELVRPVVGRNLEHPLLQALFAVLCFACNSLKEGREKMSLLKESGFNIEAYIAERASVLDACGRENMAARLRHESGINL